MTGQGLTGIHSSNGAFFKFLSGSGLPYVAQLTLAAVGSSFWVNTTGVSPNSNGLLEEINGSTGVVERTLHGDARAIDNPTSMAVFGSKEWNVGSAEESVGPPRIVETNLQTGAEITLASHGDKAWSVAIAGGKLWAYAWCGVHPVNCLSEYSLQTGAFEGRVILGGTEPVALTPEA